MIERGLKLRTCRATPRMEWGVFFKEVRMDGGRGSGGPASHTRTFPDLVPPRGPVSVDLLFLGLGRGLSNAVLIVFGIDSAIS